MHVMGAHVPVSPYGFVPWEGACFLKISSHLSRSVADKGYRYFTFTEAFKYNARIEVNSKGIPVQIGKASKLKTVAHKFNCKGR